MDIDLKENHNAVFFLRLVDGRGDTVTFNGGLEVEDDIASSLARVVIERVAVLGRDVFKDALTEYSKTLKEQIGRLELSEDKIKSVVDSIGMFSTKAKRDRILRKELEPYFNEVSASLKEIELEPVEIEVLVDSVMTKLEGMKEDSLKSALIDYFERFKKRSVVI